ncbi:MAG: DUF1592 domain-containing protein [Verrucomicrobiota bacterium]
MRAFSIVFFALHLVLFLVAQAAEGEAEPDRSRLVVDALPVALHADLQRYCFDCHGEKKAKKKLRLDQFDTVESVLKGKRVWDRVLFHIREGQMPPDDAELVPGSSERQVLLGRIEKMLDEVDWEDYRRPGREVLARLSRQQYRFTMRDLLGIDLQVGETFGEEGEGASGFRNDRSGLSADGAKVEKYLDAAERAVDAVMALVFSPLKESQRYSAVEMERSMEDRMKPHKGGMVLANPGQELSADFDFPVDGYYRVQIQASVMGKPTVASLRVEGRVAAELPVSATTREGKLEDAVMYVRRGRQRFSIENKNLFPHHRELPLNAAGLAVQRGQENAPRLQVLPNENAQLKTARDLYNERSAGVQEAYEWLRLLGVEGDSREIDRFVTYAVKRDKALRLARMDLALKAGLGKGGLESLWKKQNQTRLEDNALLLKQVSAVQWRDWMDYQGKVYLRTVKIEGPVLPDEGGLIAGVIASPGSLLNLLRAWDQSDEGVRDLLAVFLPRAFRRNLGEQELNRYEELYQSLREGKESVRDALRLTLIASLGSPDFLFREEYGVGSGEGAVERLDDFTLASRLSYFLWSTMPDDHLFDLAKSGDLSDDVVLDQVVDNMLDGGRAGSFYRSFAGQWLGIDSLGKTVVPDAQRFPEFTADLGELMKEETLRFFETIFTENRPLTEFLDSDWTYLNERLAQHYGIAGVKGEALQRVSLNDRRRGGLLGMGSVLTVTSSPARTNPMRRGFWVLEGLLGDHLGEPPGDAGELPGDAGEARGKSLREEIELHRTRKSCMSCHVKLDPIGFGLQNFDAIGRWRDEEAGKAVDSSGVMPDGKAFDGPVELKQVLLQRQDEFVKNLCARMLSYALGRKLEYYDEAELRRIFEQVKDDNYHARTLIREVVKSYPFRYRDGGG